ncbi:MAG TPA: DoxX family protein [Gemmatimonadaceae bacterium]|nr:DoxX family protein [Gemmatimonadaceae bacterium]
MTTAAIRHASTPRFPALRTFFTNLVATNDDPAALVLRVALGLVMFPHGAQKLLGWFGGYGFAGTVGGFSSMHIPAAVTVLVIAIEFLGSIALITGLFGRAAALGIIAVMSGAVFMVHLPNGFFMNWSGQQAGEGFEYHALVIAMAIAIMIRGSGAFSVDRALSRNAR